MSRRSRSVTPGHRLRGGTGLGALPESPGGQGLGSEPWPQPAPRSPLLTLVAFTCPLVAGSAASSLQRAVAGEGSGEKPASFAEARAGFPAFSARLASMGTRWSRRHSPGLWLFGGLSYPLHESYDPQSRQDLLLHPFCRI